MSLTVSVAGVNKTVKAVWVSVGGVFKQVSNAYSTEASIFKKWYTLAPTLLSGTLAGGSEDGILYGGASNASYVRVLNTGNIIGTSSGTTSNIPTQPYTDLAGPVTAGLIQVRATKLSGTTNTTGTFGSWLDAQTQPQWVVYTSGGVNQTSSASIKLEFRMTGDIPVALEGTYDLTARTNTGDPP